MFAAQKKDQMFAAQTKELSYGGGLCVVMWWINAHKKYQEGICLPETLCCEQYYVDIKVFRSVNLFIQTVFTKICIKNDIHIYTPSET
jgi:hypothetical protein